MDFSRQLKLIKSSKLVHGTWYRTTYPEVAALGIDPAVHYLRYGAAMGRNPGKGFDTRFYLETYPDVVESGLNPLVHYVLHGREQGYARKPLPPAGEMRKLRTKLLNLGFVDLPLREMQALYTGSPNSLDRIEAARELALWQMRVRGEDGYREALLRLERARELAPDLETRCALSAAELLCHHFLGDHPAGLRAYERAALAGETSDDLMLVRGNFEADATGRLFWMNQVLARYDLVPVSLAPEGELPGASSAYDRLVPAGPVEKINDGPLVSVLLAAYEAADTLPTALRSLQQQSWQNLEIIVLDDCSPGEATLEIARQFAAADPRIKVIRMEENGGAYVARNRGLDHVSGTYVTLHDADDWSHPLKIETQVRFLEANPEVMGCTSRQARALSDLQFPKWAGAGGSVRILKENVSSLMQRHAPVFEQIGYWDTVRFGADSERMRRIRRAFGPDSIVSLQTGPLSFQRISDNSIVADEAFGVDGFFFGARRDYHEAQQELGDAQQRYPNTRATNFPVPAVMRPDRGQLSTHYNVILASDFRMSGGSTKSNVEELACQKRNGIRSGVLQMYRYDYPDYNRRMLSEVRSELDGDLCRAVVFGESVSCDVLIIRYPPVLQELQRYVPMITAKDIRVIINQPPMSDYSPEGVRRYDLAACAANIRQYFNKEATWHPIGPLVRDALHQHHADELHHIDLAATDWLNIIDIAGWDRGPRKRGPGDRLRIGRHSRDHEHKWPDTREDLLAAYPDRDDVEVHVLGGAKAPSDLIGATPRNWVVHPFGTLHPREFLAGIDVFVYFSHPNWVESFGRVIIEAMAVGVPVILPEVYRPLFGEAALYATPQSSLALARQLHADPVFYEEQTRKAQQIAQKSFSYETHVTRLKALGVVL